MYVKFSIIILLLTFHIQMVEYLSLTGEKQWIKRLLQRDWMDQIVPFFQKKSIRTSKVFVKHQKGLKASQFIFLTSAINPCFDLLSYSAEPIWFQFFIRVNAVCYPFYGYSEVKRELFLTGKLRSLENWITTLFFLQITRFFTVPKKLEAETLEHNIFMCRFLVTYTL